MIGHHTTLGYGRTSGACCVCKSPPHSGETAGHEHNNQITENTPPFLKPETNTHTRSLITGTESKQLCSI